MPFVHCRADFGGCQHIFCRMRSRWDYQPVYEIGCITQITYLHRSFAVAGWKSTRLKCPSEQLGFRKMLWVRCCYLDVCPARVQVLTHCWMGNMWSYKMTPFHPKSLESAICSICDKLSFCSKVDGKIHLHHFLHENSGTLVHPMGPNGQFLISRLSKLPIRVCDRTPRISLAAACVFADKLTIVQETWRFCWCWSHYLLCEVFNPFNVWWWNAVNITATSESCVPGDALRWCLSLPQCWPSRWSSSGPGSVMAILTLPRQMGLLLQHQAWAHY